MPHNMGRTQSVNNDTADALNDETRGASGRFDYCLRPELKKAVNREWAVNTRETRTGRYRSTVPTRLVSPRSMKRHTEEDIR